MEGIIYKVIDYKDKSKICYLYTNEGLKSVKVLGAKNYKSSKFAFSNIYNLVSFSTTNNDFLTLVDYDILNSFINIKNSYNKAKYAYTILEIIRQNDNKNYDRVFNFLKKSLICLNDLNIDNSVLFIVLVKYLKLYGILVSLKYNNETNFNLSEGYNYNSYNEDNLFFARKVSSAYNSKEFVDLNITLEDIKKILSHYEKSELIYFNNIKRLFCDK